MLYKRIRSCILTLPQQQNQDERDSIHRTAPHRSTMHGDLVNGLCYSVFFPLYLHLYLSAKVAAQQRPSIENVNLDLTGPRNIVCTFAFTVVFSWLSWWKKSPVACFLAFCGMSAGIAGMNLYRWPHEDEVVVLPQFMWSLLIISANSGGLQFGWIIGMSLIAISTALLVAIYSPLLNCLEALPVLLGFTSAHLLFHYFTFKKQTQTVFGSNNNSNNNDVGSIVTGKDGAAASGDASGLMTAHAASLVLAGTFAYHMSSELVTMMTTPAYATAGGYSILKAGFFAAVGLAASGAFRHEIDIKESLEVLVEERAKEIVQQADKLRMVGFAVEASETAIAITDSSSRVLWLNPALERVAGKSSEQLLNTCLFQALPLSQGDQERFVRSFDEVKPPSETELVLHVPARVKGSPEAIQKNSRRKEEATATIIINAQVSPFPSISGGGVFSIGTTTAARTAGDALPTASPTTGTRFVVILRDITEQRARERAEKAAEQEALLARAMSDSMEMLSHELRTPLQGIMGMTSILLQDSDIHSDAKDSLALVMASSRLLLTLINNMLDVRKCDANMMNEFSLQPVPIAACIQDAVDFCRPIASIANIDLKLAFGGSKDALVLSDPLRLQQIVINLLSNAVKYTNYGKSVLIETQVMNTSKAQRIVENALARGPAAIDGSTVTDVGETKVLVVSVIDCGEGISPEQSTRIFEKFSQLEDKRAANPIGGSKAVGQPSGTGLGLNLCLKFVHRMKGRIWVTNNTDRPGSCFSFYVPLANEESFTNRNMNCRFGGVSSNITHLSTTLPGTLPIVGETDHGRKCSQESSPSHLGSQTEKVCRDDNGGAIEAPGLKLSASDLKVLVVDDTIINLKVLERMLKRIGVGKVTTVDSGAKALVVLEQEYFDVVITDIQMPEMSGTELCVAICKSKTIKGRPVVVGLTAETGENLIQRCSASGMMSVLHKPITTYQMQDFFETFSSPPFNNSDMVGDDSSSSSSPKGLAVVTTHPRPVAMVAH